MDLSLRDLAERTGVSAQMLSQVERGETSPTLVGGGPHRRRPGAHAVPAAAPRRGRRRGRGARAASACAAARAAAATATRWSRHRCRASAPRWPSTRSRRAHATGGPGDPPMHEPGSRETAVALDGSLRLVCDGALHDLDEGDAVTFDADLPHHFENAGAGRGPLPGRGRRRPEEVLTMPAQTTVRQDLAAHEVVEGLLYVDLHLVHEVTSPQAFESLRLAGRPPPPPRPHAGHRRSQRAHRRLPGGGPDRRPPVARAGRDARGQLRRVRRADLLDRLRSARESCT